MIERIAGRHRAGCVVERAPPLKRPFGATGPKADGRNRPFTMTPGLARTSPTT
jgi:hypothetical protein